MVNESGQLLTIEGLAAAMIMILTVFFVVNATSVYTPGDAHISDMQLEILGSDALRMMDIPEAHDGASPLRTIIENHQTDQFRILYLNYTNNRTLAAPDYIKFNASYTCRNTADDTLSSISLGGSHNLTGTEHPVRATKWVRVNTNACGAFVQDRAVLVEVLLWRD
jgi:hypothetical protein